jgi:hypothetical protein
MALSNIYQKASLVQIPSGYKSGTLYSVVPNTADGDFTVTGDPEGEATRVNKDGLIESVAADQARLNYDPTSPQDPHLLLEPSRQNKVYPNNSLTGYSTIGVSTTNNDAISPNGANEGAKVQATTSGTAVVFKGFTGTSGVTHNISAFVKAGTHNQIRLQEGFSASNIDVNLSTGTEVSSQNATNKKIEAYPNDWYRISFNFTSTSTNLQFALYFNGSYTSGENIYLYGGQIEEGTYATSLIPTSGSSVTRTEDFCNIPSGLQNVLNTSEGTLFVDLEVPRVATTSDFDRIVLSDQNASTDRLIFDNFGGNWRVLLLSSGNNVNKTIVSGTANQRIKVAIAYSTTGLRISYDGNTATTTSGTYAPTTTLESFKFSNKDGGSKVQGKIYQAMYFPTALTDSELQTLTSN